MSMTEQEQEEIIRMVALCENDPMKYCQAFFPWGEGALAESNGPRKWQAEILKKIRDHLADPKTCFSPLQIAVASGHGVGKSSLVGMIVDWAMKMPDTKIIITASTDKQLKTKTMPEIEKWTKLSLTKDWFKVTATSIASLDPNHERTWRADAIPWDEENTEAFQGLHNKGRRIVVIGDEASAIADKIWEVIEGALTDEGTQILWLVFGNPTRNTGRFKECFGRFKHRWHTYQIDSRTVEGTNKEQIDQWVEDYSEDSDFVRVRVRGEFPRAGSMQFIAGDIVEKARKREPYHKVGDARVMGVDVARFGTDESVIVKRVGRDAASHPWIVLRNVDTMTLAAKVAQEAKEFKPDAIFVDGGGVGGGVIDRLNMLRLPVVEVQFGGISDNSNPEKESNIVYADKGAEMWGAMNDWLRGGAIPDDPDLAMQLTGREYGFVLKNGKDAIKLEKKSDMKKRGLDSPDRADGLCFLENTKIRTPHGEKDIQNFKIGDEVVTPFGTTRVVKFWESETESLTSVRFNNGSNLCGKGEHTIFIWGKGKVRLDGLTLTNVVSVYGQRRLLWKSLSLLSIAASNIQFKPLVDIIRAESSVTALAFFIGMCGLIISEKYQKIMMFTTKMKCGGTTILGTLKRNAFMPIEESTQQNLFDREYLSHRPIGPYGKLQNGMDQKREEIGTVSILMKSGKTQNQKSRNVKTAVLSMKHLWRIASGAQTLVCRKLPSELTSQIKEFALGVVKTLWRTVIAQRNVVPVFVQTENVRATKVYNLTLEKHNAYYANDILVYNCLTFAYEVAGSDHTQALRPASGGNHEADYDPLDPKRIRGGAY